MTGRALVTMGGIAAAGVAATVAVAAAGGMGGADLGQLALLTVSAAAVTMAAAAIAARLLRGASLRARLVIGGLAGVAVALGNLGVLSALMFVSEHDAFVMGTLLVFAAAVGAAVAVALSRGPAGAVGRVERTARRLAGGDLDARVGQAGGGREISALARALDEMAERLQASLSQERDTEARRRDLMAAVSHDLRTPLAGLRAMVEAIQDGVVDDATTLRRYVGEMRRAVEALSSLVDDLFELSQLDAAAIRSETRRARVDEVVRSALAACAGQAREKGVQVETNIDGNGHALCSPRLVRVLQNLLQNAVRHTPSDGTVLIETRSRGADLELAVADTGEGIAPEHLDRVFEPFWRGDAARSTPGSGLGLALAKRIVEAMGGDIRAERRPDRGARFAVRVPG
jgi:signal transduction histidine kinase